MTIKDKRINNIYIDKEYVGSIVKNQDTSRYAVSRSYFASPNKMLYKYESMDEALSFFRRMYPTGKELEIK